MRGEVEGESGFLEGIERGRIRYGLDCLVSLKSARSHLWPGGSLPTVSSSVGIQHLSPNLLGMYYK